MERTLLKSLAAAALFCGAAALAAAEEASRGGWFGSAELAATAPLEDDGKAGMEAETRLVYESSPEIGIGFRAEGGIRWTYGAASAEALAFDASLAERPQPEDLPPGTDLHRTVFLDQAYAEAALGPADLSFGVVPVAWGTGYAFNPTARTAPPSLPEDAAETAPGALGAALRVDLPAGFSAEGYALAEPRLRSAVPSGGELAGDRFPFGAKAQFRSELIDFSLSILRELPSADSEARLWTGADAAGFLGPLSWYAEAVLGLPDKRGSEAGDWDALREAEACAGLSWTVPGLETVFRVEAAWFGSGSDDAEAYDAAALVAGERAVLARRYLFVMLEKEDPDAAKWTLSGGALANLDDRSAAVLAEGKYRPSLSLELAVFVRAFLSDGDGEFGGTRSLGSGLEFVPYRSAAGVSARIDF